MFSFIILHYKNIEDTLECLDLIKTKYLNSHIIVVDNASLNKDDEDLIKNYTNDILKLNKNFGFAKANNIGCKYAMDKYNSDFLIVINNDVFIEQDNFLEKVKYDYEQYDFDILGTKIISTSGESVNPFPVIVGEKNIVNEIKYCKKLINIYENIFLYYLLNLFLFIKHKIIKSKINKNGEELCMNIGLHGCAIIFSKKYYETYKNVFYNDTFLFHEEDFLYYRIKKDNLKSLYDPELVVFHKEGSSLKISNKNIRKSKLFREKNRLDSLRLLLDLYRGD